MTTFDQKKQLLQLLKELNIYKICNELNIDYYNFMNNRCSKNKIEEVNNELINRILKLSEKIQKNENKRR